MAALNYDFYNHQSVTPGTTYTAGAALSTAAGTVIPVTAGAGVGSSTAIITGSSPNDTRGQFNLVAAGTPAAGVVTSVIFSAPYSQLPGAVLVNVLDTTASPVAPVAGVASAVSQTGFSVSTGALTAGRTYTINYHVVA